MTRIAPIALCIAAFSLMACPAGQKGEAPKGETPKAEAPKAEAPKAEAPKAATPAPAAAAPKAASLVPAGVKHESNPKWSDRPTPTDKPALDTTAAAASVKSAVAAHGAAQTKACAAGASAVVTLNGASSRVGYESYKNGNLPVKGKFNTVGGYATLGASPSLHFWADVLSLNSGDAVRDARLLKLFFEAEKAENALLRFDADAIGGLDKGAIPAGGGVVEAKGKLSMHGVSVPMTVKLKLSPGAAAGQWKASLAEETLLPFDPYGLVEPLKALMVACNHKSMGSSVKLDFDLALTAGCK